MKIKLVLSSLIIILFVATGCAQNYGKVKGNGKVINETRNVGNFDQVSVSGSFDVFLVKGNEGKVDIKIEENLLPYIVTEVDNGKLKIRWKRGTNISTTKSTQVTVYFKDINGIGVSGSSDVVAKDKIRSNEFSVSVSGSGDIDFEIETDRLKASVSGSGDLDISGSAKNITASVAGSGDIDAYGLKADSADLKISGSGGMTITVENELKVRVSGSGDIKYKGNPRIEDIKVSGSGSVRSY